MKQLLNTKPGLKTALVFLLFFSIPVICGMFFGYQSIAGYLSPLILLLLTWLLYKQQGKNLSALGLNAKPRNIGSLFLGLILGILFFVVFISVMAWYNGLTIRFNKKFDYVLIFSGFIFLLQGVLNEELIFRGYCFKKTVDLAGTTRAVLIFAFLFIVWHWIALNAWGNYGAMLGLITTGFGHFLFATALFRSGTLFLPIGIHLGNNWASRYLFDASMGKIGNGKSTPDSVFTLIPREHEFSQLHTVGSYMISISFFLACTWMIWKWVKPPTAVSADV